MILAFLGPRWLNLALRTFFALKGRNPGLFPAILENCMVKVQITPVASPGFGPIFGLLAGNGPVFGIGGFEPPQPALLAPPFLWSGGVGLQRL